MEREREWSLFNKQTPSLICIARSHASVAVRISTRQAALLLRDHLSNVRYPNNDAALGRVMRQNRKGFKGHSCRACIASLRCRAARDFVVEDQLSNDSVSPVSKHTRLLYNMINPGKSLPLSLYRTIFVRKPRDLSERMQYCGLTTETLGIKYYAFAQYASSFF